MSSPGPEAQVENGAFRRLLRQRTYHYGHKYSIGFFAFFSFVQMYPIRIGGKGKCEKCVDKAFPPSYIMNCR